MKISFETRRDNAEDKAAKLQRKAERLAKWQARIDAKRAKLAAVIAGKRASSDGPRS